MRLDPHTALRAAEQHARERRAIAAHGRLHRLLRTPIVRTEVSAPTAARDARPAGRVPAGTHRRRRLRPGTVSSGGRPGAGRRASPRS